MVSSPVSLSQEEQSQALVTRTRKAKKLKWPQQLSLLQRRRALLRRRLSQYVEWPLG
ncbi:hypothetical protein E2C01_049532 [Portunus trituberculatus]|uniref:Uncharacterized protein n=1 Tax=Portunus trituberculatus TaxID=210409 RepID=A0A5B7G5U9_PORTR|nr:hypothetical protein [Portunus trituberculatus]